MSTNPVVRRLGKDVADMIYRIVHESLLRELHGEYYARLAWIQNDGALVMREPNTIRGQFLFNYRETSWVNPYIHHWRRTATRLTEHDTKLPENYFFMRFQGL